MKLNDAMDKDEEVERAGVAAGDGSGWVVAAFLVGAGVLCGLGWWMNGPGGGPVMGWMGGLSWGWLESALDLLRPGWLVAVLVFGLPGLGFLVGRMGLRAALREQHAMHERCEDVAYRTGLERGRQEGCTVIGDGDAWYRKGFKEGRRRGRHEADVRLAELGLGKM